MVDGDEDEEKNPPTPIPIPLKSVLHLYGIVRATPYIPTTRMCGGQTNVKSSMSCRQTDELYENVFH